MSADPRLRFDEPMGPHTTYRVGGTVAVFATAASEQDLTDLAPLFNEWPLLVVGNGSNLLVADGHHNLVALHLTGDFDDLQIVDALDGTVEVTIGAGLSLPVAARRLAAEGIRGFEWAVGVPGTIGGAVVMNAGGHGSDMAASVTSVRMLRDGVLTTVPDAELKFGYRQSAVRRDDVVLSASLTLTRGDVDEAKTMISDIVRWRREHQPGGANAGSVFTNPAGDSAGRLLDEVGAKDLRRGGAAISTKHANFIIADEGATAGDVFAVMQAAQELVLARAGIRLEPETRLVGFEEDA